MPSVWEKRRVIPALIVPLLLIPATGLSQDFPGLPRILQVPGYPQLQSPAPAPSSPSSPFLPTPGVFRPPTPPPSATDGQEPGQQETPTERGGATPASPVAPTQAVPPAPTPPLIPLGPIGGPTGVPGSPEALSSPPLPTVPSVAPLVLPSAPTVGLPAKAIFELLPGVRLFEEYTDNFNQTTTNKQSNFRTGISPGAILLINGAFIQGVVGYTLTGTYDTVDEGASLFQALSGQVSWHATPRLRLTVADSFTVSDQPNQADTLSLRTGRSTFTSNLFAATADYALTNLALRAYYRLGTFSSDDGSGDTTTNAFGAAATTPVYGTNILTVGYQYLTSQATDPSDDVSGHQLAVSLGRPLSTYLFGGLSASYSYSFESRNQGGDFQIATVSIYGSYILPGKWLFSGSIGLSQLFADSEPNRTAPSGSGNLSYFFANGAASIRYDTGFSETFSLGQNFGVVYTSGIVGSLSYRFTPFIAGYVGASYRHNVDVDVGGGSNGFNRQVRGAWVGLDIRLRRWLNLGVGYAYTDQSDPVGDAQPFTENRAFVSLNAAF